MLQFYLIFLIYFSFVNHINERDPIKIYEYLLKETGIQFLYDKIM